ncbi:MAG: zinc-ribbon domain-containing protein [Methanothermobacter sp.]|nr:zinc-ribbon domain-containing protein [Methanothermobacter sp.]
MDCYEILKWVESGEYEDIVKKHAGESSEVELKCPKCGVKLIGSENFCGMCGTKIWTR